MKNNDTGRLHRNLSEQPRTLVLSFDRPSELFVSNTAISDQWGSATDLLVNGRLWRCEESPLAVPADILYDINEKIFIGLTFPVWSPERDLSPLLHMIRAMDSSAIRIADYSIPHVNAAYPESCRSSPYLEIFWHASSNYAYKLAQLEFGEWAFGYTNSQILGTPQSNFWARPEGIIIVDVQKQLESFNLKFPCETHHSSFNVVVHSND